MLGQRRPSSATYAALTVVLTGCSLINAPDQIHPGSGGGSSSSSTGMPECTMDADCAPKASDCHPAKCGPDGTCVVSVAPAGAPCGDPTNKNCDAADTCDAMGTCQKNVAADGTFCSDCAAGPGKCALCSAGKCNDCTTRAKLKTFQNAHSLAGWKVSSPLDWTIYKQTPPSYSPAGGMPAAPVDLGRPVFGTDGNRAHPWPGFEAESSFAESPPTVIPPVLNFMSWSKDEGAGYDEKTIDISVDGGASHTTVVSCAMAGGNPLCAPNSGAWVSVSVDVMTAHPELVGKVGTVRFLYNTYDELTGFEQGWYVDQLNFAQDCGCSTDGDCSLETGTCATGKCDPMSNECVLTPQAMAMPCGSMMAGVCNDPPTCDKYGLCDQNWLTHEGMMCDTCPDGAGNCVGCGAGQCLNCPPTQSFGSQFGPMPTMGWTLTGDWKITTNAPPDMAPTCTTPGDPISFMHETTKPSSITNWVLGTDGPRTAPYFMQSSPCPGGFYSATANHVETSYARTPVVVIPANITFLSWHQDRGGLTARDVKKVRVTTDMGMNFTTLVDCNNGALHDLPFCNQVTTRTGTGMNGAVVPADWDKITIPTGALAGMKGQVEFDYDSVNTGESWERGWYIDDLNVARCGNH